MISNYSKDHGSRGVLLAESEAKELLSGPLSPDDDNAINDADCLDLNNSDQYQPVANTEGNTVFNEDLWLYKVKLWHMGGNTEKTKYLAATDIDDALRLARLYFGDDNAPYAVEGIWNMGSIILRSERKGE